MSFEFVFEGKSYPCDAKPADFTSLLITLKQILKENLPETFGLQYEDCDGDKIMLLSEEDYESMLENGGQLKIYVSSASKSKSAIKLEEKEEVKLNEKEELAQPAEQQSKEEIPQKGLENSEEKLDHKPSDNDKPDAAHPIVLENKENLDQAVEKAEKESDLFKFDAGLEAKVNALVLKAFKNNLEVVSGAVRENILNARERNKPITSTTIVESLVYIQKLVLGIERASAAQIQKLEHVLEEAINICKDINQQEIAPKNPEVVEECKKEIEKPEIKNNPLEKVKEAEENKDKPIEKPDDKPLDKPIDSEPKNDLDGEFVKEVDQVPNELKENCKIPIYKTIIVKNTGKLIYPPSALLECINHKEYNKSTIPQIEPGKEAAVVLILESNGKAGNHSADWEFRVKNADGSLTTFGKRFTVHFEVIGSNPQGKSEGDPAKKEKVYPQVVKEKAREVKEIFPQLNIDDICDYISINPKKSWEELFEHFMVI